MKTKVILPIILSLLVISLVSAIASITYTSQYVILEDNGSLNVTNQTVSGFSVLGFVCQDADCATVSNPLFVGQPLSSSTDSIVLDFPTNLASPFGYGVYFVKDNYIPGEVATNLSGTGSASAVNYLAKQRNCLAEVNITNISSSNSSINFTALMSSPINNAGLLDYVPTEIQDQYTVDALVSYQVLGTDGTNLSNSAQLVLPYSNSSSAQFSFPATQGANYTISVTGSITDSVCLNSTQGVVSQSIMFNGNGTNQTNPVPGSISNLHTTTITTSKITWVWNNPSDADFSHVIIYLDGVNVANNTATSYIAQGLAEGSTHTITIHTVDTAGNVNNTNVSNTASTLSNEDNGNGGGGSKNKKNGKTTVISDVADNRSISYPSESEEPISLGTKQKSNWLIWLIIAILAILIIIIAIVIAGTR